MDFKLQTIRFNATEKLVAYIDKKMAKFEKHANNFPFFFNHNEKKHRKENKASCPPLVRPASVFSAGKQWGKSSPFSQRPSFKFVLPPSLPKIRPPLPENSTSEVVLFFSEVAATTSEVVSTAPRARTHYNYAACILLSLPSP